MRRTCHNLKLFLVLLFLPSIQPANAAHFSIIATLPDGAAPQIGAYRKNKLYGTVRYYGDGLLFSLTPKGLYTQLHQFQAAQDGYAPNSSLVIDLHGNIFGTAPLGGTNNEGTLWKFSNKGVMTTPHAFGGDGDGTVPKQGPTLAGGTIIGAASQGALNDEGSIFGVSAKKGAYSTIYQFLSGADGHCPYSGVAWGADSTIYGTTWGGGYGGNPNGSVWKFTQASGLQTLYAFNNGSDGEWPDQAPAVDSDGNIYGTTHVQNYYEFAGAIWKLSSTGNFSILKDLNGTSDGYGPNSPLIIDTADGNLYGTTEAGGRYNLGTVFRVSSDGVFNVTHSFTGGSDGAIPTGNLVQDEKGRVFGGTSTGQVFKIEP